MFSFHQPATLRRGFEAGVAIAEGLPNAPVAATLMGRMRHAPELNAAGMKITYKPERGAGDANRVSASHKPEEAIQRFRNSFQPRIAATVDMIATGTDVKPLECLLFMRTVRSRGLFEQMKGRGVRVMPAADFASVTRDAPNNAKTHFVIVDAVGVMDDPKSDPEVRKRQEQVIDDSSVDKVIRSEPNSREALDRAKGLVTSFQQFIALHRDEIDALQILYSRPYGQRLTRQQVRALAAAIQQPPCQWTPDELWAAYEKVERGRVRGASQGRLWTDIVSLARHALRPEEDLVPFADRVGERFARGEWL